MPIWIKVVGRLLQTDQKMSQAWQKKYAKVELEQEGQTE